MKKISLIILALLFAPPAISQPTTTKPNVSNLLTQCLANVLLSISASAAIFYITGPNLNLGMLSDGKTPRRYYDPTLGGGREDIIVNSGDQFAWMFA